MRKKIVAGNWKMNLTVDAAMDLAGTILRSLADINHDNTEIILIPPQVSVEPVKRIIGQHRRLKVGGQNCHWEEKGAFTGEVSASMLKSAGADYVIVGHSERRTCFNEGHDVLVKKNSAALLAGLRPIWCCGESALDRKSGKYFKTVEEQMKNELFMFGKDQIRNVFIAYEPLWAIGTGETATPAQAGEMHSYIRNLLAEKYGHDVAAAIPLLYGGSCNPDNAAALFAAANVDGGLIGGASLRAEEFLSIIRAAQENR